MFPSPSKIASLAIIFGLNFLSHQSVAAPEALISDMELRSLPEFCPYAFQNSIYVDKISPRFMASPEQRRKTLSNLGIPGAHHFCNGLVELNRAKRGKGSYSVAISELNYSYSRMDPASPRLSYVSAFFGQALYLSGKRQQAVDVWHSAIAAQPAGRESYLAFAEVLNGAGKHKQALEILLKYDQAKEIETADAEQFLAHTYFQLKEYEKARVHAEKAHQLGYPSSTLLEKLKRMETHQ